LNLPDFIIVGVAKAGTTALYEYLNEHPEVYMSPIKETNYFAYEGKNTKTFLGEVPNLNFPIRTISEYKNLFFKTNGKLAVGEASPIYFESKSAPIKIKKTIPKAKIIIILRNPAERAFSDYMMAVKDGIDRKNIQQALNAESHYVQVGFYFNKIKRYLDLFNKENIFLGMYEDFKENNKTFIKKLYQFVGVESSYTPLLSVKHNVGGFPKSILISTLLGVIRKPLIMNMVPEKIVGYGRAIKRLNTGERRELPIEIRKSLNQIYRNDILKVQDLTKIDLKSWL
jgi:hypothetical protein